MDIVIEYVKKIAFYVIAMEFILVSIPENSYKKYIQFITGAMLILIVLKPIYAFFEVFQWLI